jgi:hypothetical protein
MRQNNTMERATAFSQVAFRPSLRSEALKIRRGAGSNFGRDRFQRNSIYRNRPSGVPMACEPAARSDLASSSPARSAI